MCGAVQIGSNKFYGPHIFNQLILWRNGGFILSNGGFIFSRYFPILWINGRLTQSTDFPDVIIIHLQCVSEGTQMFVESWLSCSDVIRQASLFGIELEDFFEALKNPDRFQVRRFAPGHWRLQCRTASDIPKSFGWTFTMDDIPKFDGWSSFFQLNIVILYYVHILGGGNPIFRQNHIEAEVSGYSTLKGHPSTHCSSIFHVDKWHDLGSPRAFYATFPATSGHILPQLALNALTEFKLEDFWDQPTLEKGMGVEKIFRRP